MSKVVSEVFTNHPAKEKWKYRACGVGVIGNKGERAKGIVCTDVNLVLATECMETYPIVPGTPNAPYPLTPEQACIVWPDRDNNVCVGKKEISGINCRFLSDNFIIKVTLVAQSMPTNLTQRMQPRSM
jgi:hypothetical protein